MRGFLECTRSNCVGALHGVSGSTLCTPVRNAWYKLGEKRCESHPAGSVLALNFAHVSTVTLSADPCATV
mgnify:CR=1 FL=1